jgi:hypothetical protein
MLEWLKVKALSSSPKTTKKKDGYCKAKGSSHQENITILNIYASKNRSLKYINQKLMVLKEEISNFSQRPGHSALSNW